MRTARLAPAFFSVELKGLREGLDFRWPRNPERRQAYTNCSSGFPLPVLFFSFLKSLGAHVLASLLLSHQGGPYLSSGRLGLTSAKQPSPGTRGRVAESTEERFLLSLPQPPPHIRDTLGVEIGSGLGLPKCSGG